MLVSCLAYLLAIYCISQKIEFFITTGGRTSDPISIFKSTVIGATVSKHSCMRKSELHNFKVIYRLLTLYCKNVNGNHHVRRKYTMAFLFRKI
jgi:hypothetical protein